MLGEEYIHQNYFVIVLVYDENVVTKCLSIYFCKSWMVFTFMIHIFIET